MEVSFQEEFEKDAFSCLRKYAELINNEETSEANLQKYLRDSKNTMIVINYLKQTEMAQEDIYNAFAFLTELLKRIATSTEENIEAGLKIVRRIFKDASKALMHLLKRDPLKSVLGLKFLTRAAMISEKTNLEVLHSFNWKDYNLRITMKDSDSRKWVFRLILVCLNKDDCIKELCNVGIFKKCLRYLVNEKASLIRKVLNTMFHKIILSGVPKQMKSKIFSTDQLQLLLPIYKMASSTDKKEMAAVGALHTLMLTLYCDANHGTVNEDKKNISYLLILSSEKTLWKTSHGKELLETSTVEWPNLLSQIISEIEFNIANKMANQIFILVSCISLMVKVIGNDTLWSRYKQNLKAVDCTSLKNSISTALEHESCSVKYISLKLLSLIYSRVSVVNMVENKFDAYPKMKCICTVTQLIQYWKSLIIEDTKLDLIDEENGKIKVQNLIANILLSYFEVNSKLEISDFLDISDLLQEFCQVNFKVTESKHYIGTSYSLIGLMSLALNRNNLLIIDVHKSFTDILSSSPFASISRLYIAWQDAVHEVLISEHTIRTENLLVTVVTTALTSLGIRLTALDLKPWLKMLSKGKKNHLEFFIHILIEAIKHNHIYRPVLSSMVKSQDHCIEEEHLLTTLNEEECRDNEDVCVIPLSEPFSSFVLSAIEILIKDPNDNNKEYFSMVMQNYIQSMSSPKILMVHLLSVNGVLSVEVKNYLESFLEKHNSDQSFNSANLSVSLDAIFRAADCPQISDLSKCLMNMQTEEVDTEFLCTKILYYVKIEKYRSNQTKRPKHYMLFCTFLIELLKIWNVNENLSPMKFLLCNSFMLESYSPFMDTDCLNESIIFLLLFSSGKSYLLDSMKPYCNKTVETFRRIVSLGDADVFSPFEIFLNTSFFSYSLLEEVVNCCSKFSVDEIENEFLRELFTKLIALFNELTHGKHLPTEDTLKGLTSVMCSLEKRVDCKDSKLLSAQIQKFIVKSLVCLKDKKFNQAFKKNILTNSERAMNFAKDSILDWAKNTNGCTPHGRLSKKEVLTGDPTMKIINKSVWKQVLKLGLADESLGALYLDCLLQIIPHMKKSSSDYNPKWMFQMLCSHSKFIDIVQGVHGIQIQEEVIKLMFVLLEDNPQLCDQKHILLLLYAYNASVSSCDQRLLKLLQIYDKRDCLSKFPPVIWGTAAKQYCRSNKNFKLKFKDLKPSKYRDILLLLPPKKVKRTASNFDPLLDIFVSQIVETPEYDIFDQRHLLMFAAFISNINFERCKLELIKSNIITIAIAALSSQVDVVWDTGALILNNLRTSLSKIIPFKYFQGNLFIRFEWFIRILGNSLNGKRVRIPYVFAQLLIEIADCIAFPLKSSAKELTDFIFNSPSMNIFDYKQLNVWLNPTNQNNLQEIVIRVIGRCGKSPNDWKFLQKNNILNDMLSLAMSTFIDVTLKCRIFESLYAICVDSKSFRKYLIESMNFTALLSLFRNDIEELSELENKADILARLESFADILNKTNNFSLVNRPVLKFSKKRQLSEDCIKPPKKVRRLSPQLESKSEITDIKIETDDYYLSEDLDETMSVVDF